MALNGAYQAATLKTATKQDAYVNELYDAKQASALQALKSVYDQNVIDLDAQAEKIPGQYQAARNKTATQAEVSRANWNAYASAAGMNSGTGAQENLAMNNRLMGDLGAINEAEANAKNDLETQRLKVKTAYNNDIVQAIADGDTERAKELYAEAVRVDQSLVATAKAQADENYRAWDSGQAMEKASYDKQLQNAETMGEYGDFSGYAALGYSAAQIAQMYKVWAAANPKLAYALSAGSYSYGGGGSGKSSSASTVAATPAKNDTTSKTWGGVTKNKTVSVSATRAI